MKKTETIQRGKSLLRFGIWLTLAGCGALAAGVQRSAPTRPPSSVPVYRYEVLAKYPHDRQAFTQGLVYHDGHLYESTGLQGQSSLRKIDLSTGRVLRKVDVEAKYFAEGLTVFQGKLYQLTWLSGVAFVYDLGSMNKIGERHYEGEGWGLTNDQTSLIMSDGSNKLKFLDPADFTVRRSIEVFYKGQPLNELNELEYIDGKIYSNVWHKDLIAKIDAATGRVDGIIDLTGLGTGLGLEAEDVLNGIAYQPRCDCLLVTGKRWPFLFKIRAVKSVE